MRTFTLRTDDRRLVVELAFGEGSPKIASGYGKWTIIERWRRRAITEWNGTEPLRLWIPITFEAWKSGKGAELERDITTLERMAGIADADPDAPLSPPATLIVDSDGFIPHDVRSDRTRRWVIENLEWADDSLRNDAGNRVRQPAALTLLEFGDDAALGKQSATLRRRTAKKKTTAYHTKPGDTLRKIAAKKLGSADKWREIRKLNPKHRDPGKVLKPNTVLKLPAT
jgi:LysM repeat protein